MTKKLMIEKCRECFNCQIDYVVAEGRVCLCCYATKPRMAVNPDSIPANCPLADWEGVASAEQVEKIQEVVMRAMFKRTDFAKQYVHEILIICGLRREKP